MVRINPLSFFVLLALMCISAIVSFPQSKTCALHLEVIQAPAPGESKEIPVRDADASIVDYGTKKEIRAALVNGAPVFAELSSGKYNLSIRKKNYHTTLKRAVLDCELADKNRVISEIIFLRPGDPSSYFVMEADDAVTPEEKAISADTRSPPGQLSGSGPADPGTLPRAGAVIYGPKASYPDNARKAGVKGCVMIEMLIDEKGSVFSAEAVKGPELLRDSAVRAAMLWKFKPKLVNGQPVRSVAHVEFCSGNRSYGS